MVDDEKLKALQQRLDDLEEAFVFLEQVVLDHHGITISHEGRITRKATTSDAAQRIYERQKDNPVIRENFPETW